MLIIEYFTPIILSYVLQLVQWDVRILAIHGIDRLQQAQNAVHRTVIALGSNVYH